MNNPHVDSFGVKRWFNDAGQCHREDGPAIEWNDGLKWWYRNDQFHRLDGPAVEWSDGTKEWWYNGEKLNCFNQEEFERLLQLELFW